MRAGKNMYGFMYLCVCSSVAVGGASVPFTMHCVATRHRMIETVERFVVYNSFLWHFTMYINKLVTS